MGFLMEEELEEHGGWVQTAGTQREREAGRSHDAFYELAHNVPSCLGSRGEDGVEEHVGLEILLELVLENTICHMSRTRSWVTDPLPSSPSPEQPRGSKE